jgi:hypothetical protein
LVILGISASGCTMERDGQGRLLKGVTEDLASSSSRTPGSRQSMSPSAGRTSWAARACLRCASDNVCKVEDDWPEIRDRMLDSEAVVFGAPVYYGTINALGHAFLERLFSLVGKPSVIVTVGTEEPNAAEDYVRRIFRSNYMAEPWASSDPGASPSATPVGSGRTARLAPSWPATGSWTRSRATM